VWPLFIFTVASSLVSSRPVIATANDYRWGRTDASAAEPGASLVALVLTPLFILFFWGLLDATSEHATIKPRSRRARTHRGCHGGRRTRELCRAQQSSSPRSRMPFFLKWRRSLTMRQRLLAEKENGERRNVTMMSKDDA